jgi:Fe-S cluster assembly iron-binding protein IscA
MGNKPLAMAVLALTMMGLLVALYFAGLIPWLDRFRRAKSPLKFQDLSITVTQSVVNHVRQVVREHGLGRNQAWCLRVSASWEPNSPYAQHKVDVVVEPPKKSEVVHDAAGVLVYVPREQADHFRGATIDFGTDAGQQGIMVKPKSLVKVT